MSKEKSIVNLDAFDMSVDTEDPSYISPETPAEPVEPVEPEDPEEPEEPQEPQEPEEPQDPDPEEPEEPKDPDPEDPEEPEEPEPTEPGEGPSFKPLAKAWFEENGWEFQDDFLEEDSLGGFNELVSKIVQNSAQPKYASEESQRFDSFVANGGDPKEFFEVVYAQTDLDTVDIKNPEEQKKLVRMMYKETTKFNDKKINREIERLENLEDLESEAEEALEILKEKQEKADKELETRQAEAKKQEEARQATMIEEETRSIMAMEDFRGFKSTRAEKENFVKFLFDKDRKSGQTAYQAFLNENPNFNREAAYIAFKGIRADKFDGKQKTKLANEVTNSLAQFNKAGVSSTNRKKETPSKKKGKEVNLDNFIL